MIPIYWRAGRKPNWGPDQISEATWGSLIGLRRPSSLRGRDPRVVGVFGVVDLACDLGTGARNAITTD
jgi:hypothetical protein